MWVDIVAGLVVAVSALTGAWRGTVSALMRLGALAVAYVAGCAVGPALAAPFGGPEVVAPAIAVAQASFVAVLVIYVVLAGLLSSVFGRLYDGATDSAAGADRFAGGCLSAVRAALLVVVFVSGMQYANRFIALHWPALWVDYDASRVGLWVREHNAFLPEAIPRQWALERLVQETRGGTWRQASQSHAAFRRVLAHPDAVALFDASVQEAVQRRDGAALARDTRIHALLSDPEVRRDLDLISTGNVGD